MTSPCTPIPTTRMLFERGRQALTETFAHLPPSERPIGLNIDVATEDDFGLYPLVLLRHVCSEGSSVYILCKSGALCSLLERLPGYRPRS